jgi:hypothetical protein
MAINDNQGAYSGYNWDNCRIARDDAPPSRDTPGTVGGGLGGDTWPARFGSAHLDVWQVAYCDGSVGSLSYTVNGELVGHLAHRNDGRPQVWP